MISCAFLVLAIAAPPITEEEAERFRVIVAAMTKAKRIKFEPEIKYEFVAFSGGLKQGEVGVLNNRHEVVKVIDDKTAIVSVRVYEPRERKVGGKTYIDGDMVWKDAYVSGMSMKNQSESGSLVNKCPPLIVDGVETYKGRKYVKLVPLDKEKFEQYLSDMAAEKKKGEEKDRQFAEEKKERDAKAKAEEEKQKAVDKREADASSKLSGAKFLKENGSTEKAKDRLKEIIKEFPGTKAAKEADELLKKW